MTKVSIIVPVYNVEKYLERCLDSLINQTLTNIEIVCINDGSTDNSGKILDDYAAKDKRIIVINKKNEGQSIARNIGIEKAKGEYLGFVDSDDWVDLDYFEKLYNTAFLHNCEMACAGLKRYKKNKMHTKKKFQSENIYNTIDEKIKADNLPNDNYFVNKIYKREAWIKNCIEFSPGHFYEDLALMLKVLHLMGTMVTVPNTYYLYRMNSNSTTAAISSKHSKDYKWAIKQLLSYAEENNINLDTSKILQKKIYIKIFNIRVMKIYYYENYIIYKLFGFIPFIQKIIF